MTPYRDSYTLAIKLKSMNSGSKHSLILLPVRALVISLFPVLCGCEPALTSDSIFTAENRSAVKTAVLSDGNEQIRNLDILVFNNDQMQKLDCYQKVEGYSEGVLNIGSQSGKKIIFVCANSVWDTDSWMTISCLSDLGERKAELENEDRKHPLMTGQVRTDGNGESGQVYLKRLSSEILLRSVSCDFIGKPYQGERISNVKAYIINVNGTCSILEDGTVFPERIINRGCLQESDMMRFSDPSLIVGDIDGEIGDAITYPGLSFICYPNNAESDGPGTPYTRLVIEGMIGSEKWYWPVNINQSGDSERPGIDLNCQYIYDIMITGKGSTDPDIPVRSDAVTINMETVKWKEKEEYEVSF